MIQNNAPRKLKAIFASLSIAIGLGLIIIFILMFKKRQNGRFARRYCAKFFPVNRVKVDRIGEYDLDATLIVVNHQSMTDIIFLEGDHPLNICWVAKKELGDIPFYGHALKGPDMILVDRDDKRAIVYLLKEAKDRLSKNRPLVIFPEGTRGPGGKSFLEFKPGAKILAEKLKLKIQPIVLINSRNVYDSKPLSCRSDYMRAVIMPSFIPSGDLWYEKLEQDMLEEYTKHFDLLNQDEALINK